MIACITRWMGWLCSAATAWYDAPEGRTEEEVMIPVPTTTISRKTLMVPAWGSGLARPDETAWRSGRSTAAVAPSRRDLSLNIGRSLAPVR
ncbi:MAG: hypothetical protein R2746_10340 [Acidimicrobiales bacterium]